MDFKKFLQDNELTQKDVAQYLGISTTAVNYYAAGRPIPDKRVEQLRKNKKWDTSALTYVTNVPKERDMMLRLIANQESEIAMLRTIIQSQLRTIDTLRKSVETKVTEQE